MDIKILDSWLREYLETPAKPEEISKYLSLSSQSVEKVNPLEGDFLYDIEVTSNRPDAFSVYGIARELSAVLPRYGLKAKLLPISGTNKEIFTPKESLPLTVKITENWLVPRFTALIFDQVKIKPSPQVVQKRLETSGIRSLNNVIDISNYLMLELGQPMHTFDYDKILKAKMIVRQAKAGEKITTLDGQTRLLSPGAIIIEDGEGRIIDLCGIMGGKNSEVDEKTQKVLLFIQTYDPLSIRRACQALAFRTEAASRFEKGIDPEGVTVAMKRAVELFKDWTEGEVASKIFDIYPNPAKERKINLEKKLIDRITGIEIKLPETKEILESLGFKVLLDEKKQKFSVSVPHWRYGDISISEDLVEEIARIYGYQNLPNNLPPISFPQSSPSILLLEKELKNKMKALGFTETPTYSMTSEENLKKATNPIEGLLQIANPLSTEWVYLRTSLIPSLLEVVKKNIGLNLIKIFEIDHIYLSQGKNTLPEEKPKLTSLLVDQGYLEAKGIIEAILEENGLQGEFVQDTSSEKITYNLKTAQVMYKDEILGKVGEISDEVLKNFDINRKVAFLDLDLKVLEKHLVKIRQYQPISFYPPIIEDLSFIVPSGISVKEILKSIKSISPLINKVELIDVFGEGRTFRLIFLSKERNLTEKDVFPVRGKIIKKLGEKGIGLKTA